MEPIINPWIAYLAYLSSSIHMLFKVLLCASVVILIIGFLCEFEFINHEKVDKFIKTFVIIISISGIGLTFVPDKETVYTTIVLDQLTEDNISTIGKNGKDVIDYVTDKIEIILDKEKNDE